MHGPSPTSHFLGGTVPSVPLGLRPCVSGRSLWQIQSIFLALCSRVCVIIGKLLLKNHSSVYDIANNHEYQFCNGEKNDRQYVANVLLQGPRSTYELPYSFEDLAHRLKKTWLVAYVDVIFFREFKWAPRETFRTV